jgi:hypothetical protein
MLAMMRMVAFYGDESESALASQGRLYRRSGVRDFGLIVDILGIIIQVDRILGQEAYCGTIEFKVLRG